MDLDAPSSVTSTVGKEEVVDNDRFASPTPYQLAPAYTDSPPLTQETNQTDLLSQNTMPNMSTTDAEHQGMRYQNQSTMDTKPDMPTSSIRVPELSSDTLRALEPMLAEERQRIYQRGEMSSELLASLEKMYAKEKRKLEQQYLDRNGRTEDMHAAEEGDVHKQNNGKDASGGEMVAKEKHNAMQHAAQGTSQAKYEMDVKPGRFQELVEYLNALDARGMVSRANEVCMIAFEAAQRSLEETVPGSGDMKSGILAQSSHSATMTNFKTAREAELERLLFTTEAENATLKQYLSAKQAEAATLKESLAAVLAPADDRSASVRAAPMDPPIVSRSASYQAIMSPRYAVPPHPAATGSNWRDRSGSLAPQPSSSSSAYSNEASQSQAYNNNNNNNATAANSQGMMDQKVYCTYWIRRGECDYAAVGCKYKHEMPTDLAVLKALGFRETPRWYVEWLEREEMMMRGARQRSDQLAVRDQLAAAGKALNRQGGAGAAGGRYNH
ncbi:MAG: hypothetical protein M1835_005154 [Candelina submexicana]|nr:MAG: hypothetical protein M1835_005154 [Candelina submexicana]